MNRFEYKYHQKLMNLDHDLMILIHESIAKLVHFKIHFALYSFFNYKGLELMCESIKQECLTFGLKILNMNQFMN